MNIERSLGNATFKARIGSVNRLSPVSIYVTGKAYISPTENLDDYSEQVDGLESDLKKILGRYARSSKFLNNVCITNLEIPKNALKYGKNTFMFFQFFFSQNFENQICTSMEMIKREMQPGIDGVLWEFKDKLAERGFTIHEKRRS